MGTSKYLQSLETTSKSGRSTLPSRYAVKVFRLKPVANATSEAVIFRPNTFSFSFQNEKNVIFTIAYPNTMRILLSMLTFPGNYDIIVIAKSFNALTIKSVALISLIFRGSKSPNQCSLNGLATANRLGLLLSRKIGESGKRANAHHFLNTRKVRLSYVL